MPQTQPSQTSTHPPDINVIDALADRLTVTSPSDDRLKLDARTYDQSLSCVHCGLCLPACPTYTQNGLEADSPRGRIYLMKNLADGKIQPTESVLKHLDLCLDCQACETACPSGVVYHELIEETRDHLTNARKSTLADRLVRLIFLHVFPYPTRLKITLAPVRLLQKIKLWKVITGHALMKKLPLQLQKMQQMLPQTGPLWERTLHSEYLPCPQVPIKAHVTLFAGCVGSVLFQEVNRKTIALLTHLGCRVTVHRHATCCGAIHHHSGDSKTARKLARTNIDVLLNQNPKPDFIVNNIAGCGASLKDYDHLLRDDPEYAQKASDFVSCTRDISELILELNPPAPAHPVAKTITYHHACHLVHAQKAGDPPLKLLQQVKDLNIQPLPEADMCCGAAGTYNLTQPAMAMDLAKRKIQHIQETEAPICVTANVGCAMQLESEAKRHGVALTVLHPVDILHEAYLGADSDNRTNA